MLEKNAARTPQQDIEVHAVAAFGSSGTGTNDGQSRFWKMAWFAGWATVLALGIWLRAGVLFESQMDTPFLGDARVYTTYAWNMKVHGVFSKVYADRDAVAPPSDAFVAPGFPVFLSLFVSERDGLSRLHWALWAQLALSVATLFLAAAVFHAWLPQLVALFAALLTAISPHLINASIYYVTEPLFTFLLTLGLAAMALAFRRRNLWIWLGAGAALALATMVRPTTLFLVPLLALCALAWTAAASSRQRWLASMLMLAPLVAFQGGWMIRSQQVTGRAMDPTLSANFLQHGMYIGLKYNDVPESYGYPYRFDPLNAKLQGNRDAILDELQRRIRAEPWRYLKWFVLGKPVTFLSWHLTESIGNGFIYPVTRSPYFDDRLFYATHVLARAMHPVACVLACIGVLLLMVRRRRDPVGWIMALTLVYFIAFHMIGAPFPRYSIPVRIPLYGLAACALWELFDISKQRRWRADDAWSWRGRGSRSTRLPS